MLYSNILLGLLWAGSAYARYTSPTIQNTESIGHDASVDETISSQDQPMPPRDLSETTDTQIIRRDTYPINCHLHNWPSASVESIKEAYSWFYQLWAPLEADAQHCRRIACFGTSGVWLCADSLDFKKINSVTIADKMNDLLDGDHGCLDQDNSSMVQGQIFTSDAWNVLVRGGEDCSADVPEQPIFY
ncbi:hypothetical protein F4859DRAFT_464697 [Xylaria cf. heliscus]|nr:hypothetical protein F4859DRAFT_464697 [Xylaria cf. heliscus]